MRLKNIYILLLWAFGNFGLLSCSTEKEDFPTYEKGEKVKVTLSLGIKSTEKVKTRAAAQSSDDSGLVVTYLDTPETRADDPGSDQERKVEKIRILQFVGTDLSSQLVLNESFELNWQASSEIDIYEIDTELYKHAASAIYCIANDDFDFSSIATYGDLLDRTKDFTEETYQLKNIPMVGSYFGAVGTGLNIPVELVRMVARLDFKLDFQGVSDAGGILKLTSAQLKSVPTVGSYTILSSQAYPDLSLSNFEDYTLMEDEDGFDDGKLLSWYMPENLRGTNNLILNEKEKWTETDPSFTIVNDSYATHLVLKGTYQSSTDPDPLGITITIYPGGNNTDDFNIVRNGLYSMNLNFKDIAPDDKRIELEEDEYWLVVKHVDIETDQLIQEGIVIDLAVGAQIDGYLTPTSSPYYRYAYLRWYETGTTNYHYSDISLMPSKNITVELLYQSIGV